MKGIGILRKLQFILPPSSSLTIYRSFMRPHLNYEDVIYDQPSDKSFLSRIVSIQYNAALSITWAIIGASREKLYHKLGLEHLYQKRWMTPLCLLYKVLSTKQPGYSQDLLPPMRKSSKYSNTFNILYISHILHLIFSCKTEYFKNSFFWSVVSDWNKLNICKFLLKFIRPVERKTYHSINSVGIKLLTRLKLSFCHLREHKFRNNFKDTLNPLSSCSIESETTTDFFLCCKLYNENWAIFINDLANIDQSLATLSEVNLAELLTIVR